MPDFVKAPSRASQRLMDGILALEKHVDFPEAARKEGSRVFIRVNGIGDLLFPCRRAELQRALADVIFQEKTVQLRHGFTSGQEAVERQRAIEAQGDVKRRLHLSSTWPSLSTTR